MQHDSTEMLVCLQDGASLLACLFQLQFVCGIWCCRAFVLTNADGRDSCETKDLMPHNSFCCFVLNQWIMHYVPIPLWLPSAAPSTLFLTCV